MVYGIGNNCLKLLMFVANFLIFVIGAVIFGLSLCKRIFLISILLMILGITLDKNFAETLRKLADSFK